MIATPGDVQAYWLDTLQRSVLFLDVLRERGNQFIEHVESGKPPVLVFDHDLVMDGETLERPCNYFLLRIRPPAGKPTDPKKRPFVVFDPRAGHGPGIGGSKESSQVGVALEAGHPVYFVAFRPKPVPGQTLGDVAWAEMKFLEKVAELHPEAEAKPAIVGNCQAGWAIMLLSAYAPETSSVIAIAGAPLSYWAGIEGRDPMRYLGGLMGGNWLSAMMADIGNGIFDGSSLVGNFENLNPGNTLVGKPYNLYSKVDTERARYLNFEKWWGGHFLLTKEEIVQLTSELFVGNKLAAGNLVASDGTPLDLRAIRAPIVVICSEGDNITPPPQALNWVLDLYADVEEMQANEQTVIYTVHPTVGHLGIFVSGKVAVKEHAQFVDTMDLIEALPPGLFEMVVETVEEDRRGRESYTVRFEARTFDDLRAYDDGREDEKPFRSVAKVSEINEGLYETYLGPWVRMMSNDASAEFLRATDYQRMRYTMFSDRNPMMLGIKVAAEMVKQNRQAAPAENPLRAAEIEAAKRMQEALDTYAAQRDRAYEAVFKAIWTHPLTLALTGEAATHADSKKPRPRTAGSTTS
jgi:pimeloyl-ACP methyl ester carboxylesterase